MANSFSLDHIDISRLGQERDYQSTKTARRSGVIQRVREEHGARLAQALDRAFSIGDEQRQDDPDNLADGIYVEVELTPRAKAASLEKRRERIRPGATIIDDETHSQKVTLFVPDSARPALKKILDDYTGGALTKKENPPHKPYVEQIEDIRQAHLESFWTDKQNSPPEHPQDEIWWEVWCWRDSFEEVRDVAGRIGIRVADRDRYLIFPEQVVMPVFAPRASIEILLLATGNVVELRKADDNPTFFMGDARHEQIEWVEDLAERTVWPGNDAPAVCLFDTGVNRSHALIEPALAPEDVQAVNAEWGGDDHDLQYGHGTGMAGLALHGDLTPLLAGDEVPPLRHRLESVKLLPPNGFDANDPHNYGSITQAAVALPEITQGDRQRTYCMAVSNHGRDGAVPTTWSAAIDQAAAGVMPGDPEDVPAPKRLFFVSTGNIPDTVDPETMRHQDSFAVEDPAQAWNALTIGGYTDKTDVVGADLRDWRPFADVGCLSPFSRTSVLWHQGGTPYKPDLVLEAGNRALSPEGRETIAGVDSLSLLTTGRDVDRQPLDSFWATSAATAQAARMAGALMAVHPLLWPETIRALLVHSAEWTPAMRQQIEQTNGKADRYALLRCFGYGVPSLERALMSAQNHLALFTQRYIQPFKREDGREKFGQAHIYPLPWPRELLERLGNARIQLKITLSYFVEPYPGAIASIDPYRYQSFGLRFDLKRLQETQREFLQRVNAKERPDPRRGPSAVTDSGWWFGPNSVSAGSLHCDVWEGPAVDLATRDMLWVYPVMGWWRERSRLGKCDSKARYALVATISSPDTDLDIYTDVNALIDTLVDVDITV